MASRSHTTPPHPFSSPWCSSLTPTLLMRKLKVGVEIHFHGLGVKVEFTLRSMWHQRSCHHDLLFYSQQTGLEIIPDQDRPSDHIGIESQRGGNKSLSFGSLISKFGTGGRPVRVDGVEKLVWILSKMWSHLLSLRGQFIGRDSLLKVQFCCECPWLLGPDSNR